jgi:hypothetical protein
MLPGSLAGLAGEGKRGKLQRLVCYVKIVTVIPRLRA